MTRAEVLRLVKRLRDTVSASESMGSNVLGRSEELYGMEYWTARDAAWKAEQDLVRAIDAYVREQVDDRECHLRSAMVCAHKTLILSPEGPMICALCGTRNVDQPGG